jgi:hypothetical protein
VYTASLVENNTPNVSVLNISASDADSGPNAVVEYALETGSTDTFSLDSETGEIIVLESLNREQGALYELVVTATDRGAPPLSTSALVRVMVTDSNDNSPEFVVDEIDGILLESQPPGATIAIFTAVDEDEGANGAVTYSIQGEQTVFSIDHLTGAVTLETPLDYELATTHSLSIVATDDGIPQRFATATLFIDVVDVNDNAPVFSEETYTVSVSEGLGVGSPVLQANATDIDSGVNAEITFRLIGGNQDGIFSLDPQSAALALASPLDFEVETSYLLTIAANNSASSIHLVSTATVHVIVSEENEFSPTFTQSSYEAEVAENQPIGTFVLQFEATDMDAGSSRELTFRFITGNEGGILNVSSDGEVRTVRQLNREQVSTYHLIVAVSDAGSPSLS